MGFYLAKHWVRLFKSLAFVSQQVVRLPLSPFLMTTTSDPTSLVQRVLQQLRRFAPNLEAEPALSLHLHEDIGLDSLELVEFVVSLEQTLHLEIPDAEIGEWRTLEDVYRSVERHAPTGQG